VAEKRAHFVLYALTWSNIERFLNLFHSELGEHL